MRVYPATQLATWIGGQLLAPPSGELPAVGPDVVIDSRAASAGSLFVALPGDRVDGRDFAPAAAAAGAAAVLAAGPTPAPITHLMVDDPVIGLSNLARHLVKQERQRGMTSVALTGSSGKTSTKDLLAQILEAAGPTVAPEGSFNNEIGVPLTAARVDDQTRFLVSEMGARGRGHLSWLASVVPPDIGLVLNVGSAHVGEFGSVEAIADSKAELIRAVSSSGWAVLNADDPRVAAMASQTAGQVAWFSVGPATDVPPTSLSVHAERVAADDLQRHSFTLVVRRDGRQRRVPVRLPLIGPHHVANACAAACAAVAAAVSPDLVAEVLSRVEHRSRWRMELRVLPDGVAVLNDAYNANPDSMSAALTTLAGMITSRRATYPGARAIAVLGDMLELGPQSADRHRSLGEQAVAAGADEVVAVGDWAADVVAGARSVGGAARVASREEVAASLRLASGDLVLIKGSRGVALERVADELLATRGGAE